MDFAKKINIQISQNFSVKHIINYVAYHVLEKTKILKMLNIKIVKYAIYMILKMIKK